MKKRKLRTLIVSIILLGLVVTPFLYIGINKMIYAQRVKNYLLDVKGYKKEDIKSVEGVWGIKLPAFYAVVVFTDEPDVEYTYFAHNRVLQFSYTIKDEAKRKGLTKDDLKHYVPLG
ncbi:DUF3139 domain-containing protein [Brevibacillus migulae]|uniref:DUF3139 domain-containing protein n=1 Tax=Brevibacillus migulae TaxID=1644114 RepID=UPI00106DF4F2|nr:DUF3139 domain-containing protein [Brevibacillus migulae]